MKKIFVISAFVFCVFFFYENLIAQEESDFSDQDTEKIIENLPKDSMIRAVAEEEPEEKKNFLIIKSEQIALPENLKNLSQEEVQLSLFNSVSRISTQKGITYISRRAGYKPKVLFEESFYIESPENPKVRLEDPVSEKVPQTLTRFVSQKDTTFGSNVYSHKITANQNEILIEIQNLTTMKYHGITCLKPEELKMYISIIDDPDKITLTSAARVYNHDRTIKILFLTVDIENSFSRRIDAVSTWFKNLLNQE